MSEKKIDEENYTTENKPAKNEQQDIPHASLDGQQPYQPGCSNNAYGHYSYNPYGQGGYQQNGSNQQNFSANNNQQDYHWKFEDYEAAGRGNPRQPKRVSGLAVIGALLGAVLLVGVVCLSGYGIYSLWNAGDGNGITDQNSSQADNNASTPGLTIKDHPSSDDAGIEVLSNGILSTVEIARKVRPSVVGIAQYSVSDTFLPSGEGSGIILNSEGYIITNAHVVEGSTGINVELDSGETYSARLIGIDTKTDLAIIKIEAQNLVAAEFGNSESLEVGEKVIAIGNPGGSTLAGSVTQGIVSAVNRMIKDEGYSSKFIQTDAAINPGNSGGALVNEYGQVIGINSSKIAAVEYEGIGFAIPVSEVKPVIDDLMAYGYVKGRTKIGISGAEINETLSQINSIPVGIYVTSIDPTSDLAGKSVTKGDIITAIDGVKIETFDDVSAILKTKVPGDSITLTFYRSARGTPTTGQTFNITIKLVEDVDNATLIGR